MKTALQTRFEPLLQLGLAAALLLSLAAGLLVRIPEGAGLGFSLTRHGPHLLLALVAGAGFGVSGAVQVARDPAGWGHAWLLALSTGAAFGGTWGAAAPRLSDGPGFVLGALLGGAVFFALAWGATHLPVARRLATGLLLLAMLGAGLFAAVQAKGDPTGLRAPTWWLLGDLSRVRFATALPISLAIVAATVVVFRRAGEGPDPGAGAGDPRRTPGAGAGDPRRTPDAPAALLFGLCLGAVGLVAFFSLIVAVAARWLLRRGAAPARARSGIVLAGLLGALGLLWADALPRALFGGLAPPLGLDVGLVAVPWLLLRNDGRSSPPTRTLEVLLGLGLVVGVGAVVYVLTRLAAFIA